MSKFRLAYILFLQLVTLLGLVYLHFTNDVTGTILAATLHISSMLMDIKYSLDSSKNN